MKSNGIGVALLMLVAPAVFADPPDVKPTPASPVSVTNTSANPVPVSIQGTSTVQGSVTVTNTPNVNVVNVPKIRDKDNPALQPVSIRLTSNLAGTNFVSSQGGTPYTVPANKRLVIEYVGSTLLLSPGTNTGKAFLEVSIFDSSTSSFIRNGIGTTSDFVQCTLTQTCAAISSTVRMYANPGSTVSLDANANVTSALTGVSNFLEATLSGYLVDLN